MNNIIRPTFGEPHITLASQPFRPTPHLKTVTGTAMIITIDGDDLPPVFGDRDGTELTVDMVVQLPDGTAETIADLRLINRKGFAIFTFESGSFLSMYPCRELVALDEAVANNQVEHPDRCQTCGSFLFDGTCAYCDPEGPPWPVLPPFAPPPDDDDNPADEDTEEVEVVDPDEGDTQTECYIAIRRGSRHKRLIRIYRNGCWTIYRGSFGPLDADILVRAISLAAQIVKELASHV